MTDLLLKFFHVPTTGKTHVVGSEIIFGGGVGTLWLVLLFLVLTALSIYLYRREENVPAVKRWTMAALRALLFLMLLMLIAQPIIRFTLEGEIRKALLVLMDVSASMSINDARSEPDDIKRAAIASGLLDPTKGLAQDLPSDTKPAEPSRYDLVREVLKNDKLNLLDRLKERYDLRFVAFGDDLLDVPVAADKPVDDALTKINPDKPSTAMGDALRATVSKSRGQPLVGVLMMVDGANNRGSPPMVAADLAAREGVPVFAYGVGITHPKDIAVTSLISKEIAFVDDQTTATARLKTSGMVGSNIKVVAKLNDKVVGEKSVKITADGEQLVEIPVKPVEPGRFKLTIGVDPLAAEAVKDNNSQSQQIRVVDQKIKVLYVEQQPRWEFKYLQATLLRDRRIDAKFVLIESDPALSASETSPYLPKLPPEKETLFKFDLIIIGDVDPKLFSEEQSTAIEQFVSRFGGAVVMIAGERFAPDKYTGTPLEKMLPVEWENQSRFTITRPRKSSDAITFERTPAGVASDILRLDDEPAESEKVWKKLPPLFWTAQVSRPKPAAEVLLVDADAAFATRFGKMPIIATQQYGLGTTMFIGSDNLWRWRKNAGDKYHARLWGQIIQHMSLPHLLGESRRTQLVSDKKSYSVADRATVYARLYTEAYDPITEGSVRATIKRADGTSSTMVFQQVVGQPGMYRGEMTVAAPGVYKVSVDSDPSVTLDLPVTAPKIEFADTAMNESLLRSIAETSHGKFFREEDLYKLPDEISKDPETVKTSLDVDLWSTPIFFLVMLILAGAEWAMRKMNYLK